MAASSILIPVQGSEEVVEVDVSELPDDEADIVNICLLYTSPSPRDRG